MRVLITLTILFDFFATHGQTARSKAVKSEINRIDSIARSIDRRQQVSKGLVEGTTATDNGLSWSAYYYYLPNSEKIIKISFNDASTRLTYYYFKNKLIKVVKDDSAYYNIKPEVYDAQGNGVGSKIKDEIDFGHNIRNSIIQYRQIKPGKTGYLLKSTIIFFQEEAINQPII